jgi:protein O-GlcNAc transferase
MTMQGLNRAERRRQRKHAPAVARPIPTDLLVDGIESLKRGDIAHAEQALRQFLSQAPNHPDGFHYMGVVRLQQGDHKAAIDLMERSIALNPAKADFFANLGAAYQITGRGDEARSAYERAIAMAPRLIEPRKNLAIIHESAGRTEEAIECSRQVLEIDPQEIQSLCKLGDLLLGKGRYAEALDVYERVLPILPGDPICHNNLGSCYERAGRMHDALRCYRRAVELAPGKPELLNNLGILLKKMGQIEEAKVCLAQARELAPDSWDDDSKRARWLANQGQLEEAIELLLTEAEAGSEDVALLVDLAGMLLNAQRPREAHTWLIKALDLKPDDASAMYQLGSAFFNMGEIWQAEAAFRKTLELQPGHAAAHLRLCEIMENQQRRDEAAIWSRAALLLEGVSAGNKLLPYKAFRQNCDFAAIEEIGDIWECANVAQESGGADAGFLHLLPEVDTLEKAMRHVALHQASARQTQDRVAFNPLPPLTVAKGAGRLRVGLLSYDLRSHSAAKFVLPLLRNYDREKIELIAYSLKEVPNDPVQRDIRGLVDRFVDVNTSMDRELAEIVRADGTDVLVDMGGYTHGSRIKALAYRAAPIQVEWLGYPFTTGFKEVDYMLVDQFVKPEIPELFVEESLVLPHSWLCFEGFPETPIDPTLPCERNGFVTFGTLNNSYKFTAKAVEAWAKVMRAVPDSRFLLVRPAGQSRILAENLMKAFGAHGIAGERIFILGNEVNQHLECYNQIDIALDTFPVTGGTTTCDAMWMGVPTVSLRGPSMHQRVSHSLLMQVNLGELSVDNLADYVNKAVALANDRESLHLLRRVLRDVVRNSPIFRGDLFAEGFAQVLWDAARAHGLR